MTNEQIVGIGLKALQDQQLPVAERIFKAVLEEDPQNSSSLRGLAQTYEVRAQQAKVSTDPAVAASAASYSKTAMELYLKLAAIYWAAKETSLTEMCYRRVQAIDPNHPQARLGLARVLTAAGRDWDAIELYNDYLNKFKTPNAPPDTLSQAGIELAQARRRSRLPGSAIASLEEALKRDREKPEIYIELARCYLDPKVNQIKKAEQNVITALQKAPTNPEYIDVYAQVRFAQLQFDEARAAAAKAITITRDLRIQRPDSQELIGALDRYYSTYQQILRKILTKDLSNTRDWVDLAHVMEERASIAQEQALYGCLEALRAAPPAQRRDPRMMEAYIEIFTSLKQPLQAQTVARQLLLADKNNAVALRTLAQGTPTTEPASQPAPAIQPAPSTQGVR